MRSKSGPSRRDVLVGLGAGSFGALVAESGVAALSSRRANGPEEPTNLMNILAERQSPEVLHMQVGRRLGGAREQRFARVGIWAKRYPAQARRLLETARNDVRGLLVLPGTLGKPYFVGSPPDWAASPVGDSEFLYFLNRMYSWPRLLRAWVLSGDETYVRRAVLEFDDWVAANPRPPLGGPIQIYKAATPWRALEAGLRMQDSWRLFLEMLAGTPWMPPERLADFYLAAHRHGEILSIVAPQLWPGADSNQYLTECNALLTIGSSLPELRMAAHWREQGWREVNRCLKSQLSQDGGQIEGSPHYHNVCLRTFSRALVTARSAGLAVPGSYETAMRKAMLYSAHSFRPSGTIVPWGDSDAIPNGLEAALWGAIATGDRRPATATGGLVGPQVFADITSELYWEAGEPEKWASLPVAPGPAGLSRQYLDRGNDQFMARSDWTKQALSVFFGCHTPVRGTHSHVDPASFDFTAYGRPLVVDPGRYTYRPGRDRTEFRSATSHNTVTVNGREPFAQLADGTFGPQRQGHISRTYKAPNLVGAEALHSNFAPAVHRRAIALLDGLALAVFDEFDGLGFGTELSFWFHLDFPAARWSAGTSTAGTQLEDGPNVVIHALPGLDGTILPGRVSDALDAARPSSRLRLTAERVFGRQAFVTLIEPVPAGRASAIRLLSLDGWGRTAWQARIAFSNRLSTLAWIPGQSLRLIRGGSRLA